MFKPEHYSGRASELEALAKGISDLTTREMCLELARRFRDIANVKNLTQQSDIEVVHLAYSGQPIERRPYDCNCQGANDYQGANPKARDAIKEDIKSAAEAMRIDGTITMRWPYLLGSTRLP